DVLQHFHARDQVVTAIVGLVVDLLDEMESQVGHRAKTILQGGDYAVAQFAARDFLKGSAGSLEQCKKGPIAAAVIEEPLGLELLYELQSCFEPAPMAPGDQGVLGIELFLCVKPLRDDLFRCCHECGASVGFRRERMGT